MHYAADLTFSHSRGHRYFVLSCTHALPLTNLAKTTTSIRACIINWLVFLGLHALGPKLSGHAFCLLLWWNKT